MRTIPPKTPVRRPTAHPACGAWRTWSSFVRRESWCIVAGLAVLMLVPLLSDRGLPEELAAGSGRPSGSLLTELFLPEPGVDGMSPGGPMDGGFAEQKNRDPLALIRGPQRGKEAPSAGSAPGRQKRQDDWGSAIKEAVRAAAPSAARKAGLPRPSRKLAGALRGLMERAAGGAARGAPLELPRLAAPSSQGLFSALRPRDSLPASREASIRGVATRGGGPTQLAMLSPFPGRGTGQAGAEPLRDAIAASGFSAAQGGAAGGPGAAEAGRFPSPSGIKDARTASESLAYLRAKTEMEKELDLKYAKRRYNELERGQMLDKVKAEGAAKMAETVVGKALDGLFGLAQNGKKGAGTQEEAQPEAAEAPVEGAPGGGTAATAVGANALAEEERRRLEATLAPLGRAGSRIGGTAEQLLAGGDTFLAPKLSPALASSGGKLASASSALKSADAALARTNRSLADANAGLEQANMETARQEEALRKYVSAAGQRIAAWDIEGFSPGVPVGGGLGGAADASRALGAAERGVRAAGEQLAAADQAAAASPRDLRPETSSLRRAIEDPAALSQRRNYGALARTPKELESAGAALERSKAAFRAALERAAQAKEKTEESKEAAAAADAAALKLRSELRSFDGELEKGAEQLQDLANRYAQVRNRPEASAVQQAFESLKSGLGGSLDAEAGKVPAIRQKLRDARRRLGASSGG
ncbi:MAG: hypothetical protein HY928_04780 [Elusimicrobia bacterium]|nr:hypothetical protein [Elusimicrobiota bacterium]